MASNVWFLWQKRFNQFEVVLGLTVLILILVDRNSLNAIQSHLDVDYLHWTSKFPAVSLCTTHFQASRNLTHCEEVFRKCLWNNQSIDCCTNFDPLVSATKDLCYTFNSDFTSAERLSKYVVSHFAKSGVLETETKYPVQVFVHDGKSVNFTEPGLVVTKRRTAEILVKINSIIVDESLYNLSFEKRGCILPGERFASGFPIYSESLCRARCTDPSWPMENTFFGPFSTQDYRTHFHRSSQTQNLNSRRKKCDCPPSCEEDDVRVVWINHGRNNGHAFAGVKVTLISPPTERLILKARFDRLQLLVTMACFSRLFTSNNLLDLLYSGFQRISYSKTRPLRRKLCINELL